MVSSFLLAFTELSDVHQVVGHAPASNLNAQQHVSTVTVCKPVELTWNVVSRFRQLRPPMMTNLLRKLTVDVPALSEHTITPLRVSCFPLGSSGPSG